jgi:hypothetical protein
VAASLPFAPEIVLAALEHCAITYPRMESEYGLVCSVNPTFVGADRGSGGRGSEGPGWISHSHFALDQGPVILMIENHRSELSWRLMRGCPYVIQGLRRAGFSGGWLTEAPPVPSGDPVGQSDSDANAQPGQSSATSSATGSAPGR